MKEKDEEENMEKDTSELNIEELTDIQGGIEDDDKTIAPTCGLGCFQGSVYQGNDTEE